MVPYRILFNDYSNSEQRKIIQEECSKRYLLYNQQLERIIELLHELVDENVVFKRQSGTVAE